MKRLIVLLLLLLAFPVFSQTAVDYEGTTYFEDAPLRESAPTTNQGSSINISMAPTAGSRVYLLLRGINFTDSIPAGSTILTCSLQVYVYSIGGSPLAPIINQVCPSWVEGEVTWNIYSTGNNWSTAGAEDSSGATCSTCGSQDRMDEDAILNTGSTSNGYKVFGIDPCIAQQWLDGDNTAGILLRPTQLMSVFLSEASSTFYPHWLITYEEGGSNYRRRKTIEN